MKWIKTDIKYFIIGVRLIIPIATFILVSVVSYKALINKNKTDNYEEFFTTIDYKMSNTVDVSYTEVFSDDTNYESMLVQDYMKCIDKRLTYEELSDKMKLSMKTLEKLFNSSYNYFAFKYVDIYTGFSISHNEEQEIFTASTIKAPEAIYLYKEAEKGNINLDDTLTYTQKYYNDGSGVLKNREFNVNYTIRDLISYSIIYSDNAAHNMLMDNYGRKNMYNYWTTYGTTSIFRKNSNWGVINANDASIYMKELYNYYSTNTKLSNELMSYFKNTTFKPITDKNRKPNTANKAGWTGSTFHDVAIVLDNNPYILVILTNTGINDNSQYIINQTSKIVGQLHEEYWNIKKEECNKIING